MATPRNSFSHSFQNPLPYTFARLANGKIRINMQNGGILFVSLDDAKKILAREDLSTQKREAYEAALEWDKEQVQQ